MSFEKNGTPLDGTIEIGKIEPTGEACEEFYPSPCCMVIFGASGDLAHRKLIPALYRLTHSRILTDKFFIIGASRTKMTDDAFRAMMEKAVKGLPNFDRRVWNDFAKRMFYKEIDYGDAEAFAEIKTLIAEKEKVFGTEGNKVFYLATPPSVYSSVIEGLAASKLADEEEGWSRIVIEKPYGRDTKSALELEDTVHKSFREGQVFRIDHYLGKETVQNILMLRFANSIFEPIWNRRYIDHIQITVAESLGIEKRAGYYEQAGVLRDMFQNHMLQVLALVAMEPPSIYESELVRDERIKVLRSIRPVDLNNIDKQLVLGQYVEGLVDGKVVPGYREEPGVAADSSVPTFAAMKTFIDNWRWNGVPFYLRSGKRLAKRFTQIKIQFKQVPHLMFRETLEGEIGPNALVLMIQPDERVQLKFHTKNPGSRVCLRDVTMDFKYTEGYTGLMLDAYERVLMDCMIGDKMLFVRSEGMALSWSFLTPVIKLVESQGPKSPVLNLYRAGSYGPVEADKFIQKDGREWSNYA